MKKLGILSLFVAVLLLTGCGVNYGKLESDLKDKAGAYYDKYIKGYVSGITEQKVTIDMLSKVNVDIKEFNDNKCDKEDSYAIVALDFDKDGKETGKYTVTSHIKCENYETK